MNIAVAIVLVLVGVGLFFGFVLALADKKYRLEVNPLIEAVEDVLPKGQCGACGFAGCKSYAEAVVTNPEVPPNLCVPGKEAVAQKVAELTGKQAAPVEPRVATVLCAGGKEQAQRRYDYRGVPDCNAANLLFGGPKSCAYGCLGFGTCVRACPFGALSMGPNGLPVVNTAKCTGCGKCVAACPKHVMALLPLTAHVRVNCRSHAKGAVVRQSCTVGCLGCTLCMRQCPHGAIVMDNNLPVVDHTKCAVCTEAKCLEKCPTKAIQAAVFAAGGPVKAPPEQQTACGC